MTVRYGNEYGLYSAFDMVPTKRETVGTEQIEAKKDTFTLSSEGAEYLANTTNIPTKGYIDKVINRALNNIKNGENVAENRRILSIFSNIIGENPISQELRAYI
ncbi:MAG: hypothetical protein IJD28_08325 [Deferribacterales bacterium]|nr:hypothetical protein [Deferribacterales bacterium]